MITVVANLKGGSGKSTVVFNLSLWLLIKGQTVTAYDLDPQQTLLDVAEVRRDEGYKPALHVYSVTEFLQHNLQYRPQNDHVLIDVGAANLDAMKKAITLADQILIPVPPGQADVWATQRFMDIVDEATNGNYPKMHAFVNKADTHPAVRETGDTEEALKQIPHINLIPRRLYQRTIYRRSLSEGMAVPELSRDSKASDEVTAFASYIFPNIT